MGPRPLQALVTRPRDQAEALAAALAARGIAALVEPLIEIRYRKGVQLDFAGAQAVLCTSANGVQALAQASDRRDLPLFAVGDATAARARREAFASVVSAGGDAVDLARLVAARLSPRGGRLLHVAGTAAAGDLGGRLRRQGFAVERAILYEARPAAALSGGAVRALREASVDFALFFSPRTSATFVRLAASAGIDGYCRRIIALSISRAADEALGALPWRRRQIAGEPNQGALLAALDDVVGKAPE